MKLTVHVEGDAAECAEELRAVAATLEGAKPGKKAKGKPAKVEEAEDLDDEEDDTGDEEQDEDEDADEDDAETSLEDLLEAFKAYAAKHSREKALKILAKYKVKAVKDLPESKYEAVMALLSK